MNYYISEKYYLNEKSQNNAAGKAPRDIETILARNGFEEISINLSKAFMRETTIWHRVRRRLFQRIMIRSAWAKALHNHRNAQVFIQYPFCQNKYNYLLIEKLLKRKNVKLTVLVHDLEMLRAGLLNRDHGNEHLVLAECKLLETAEIVIVHNAVMKQFLCEKMGLLPEKVLELKIFDYLFDSTAVGGGTFREPVVIAGNLAKYKAGYISDIDEGLYVNLYGLGYEEQPRKNIKYQGAYSPEALPLAMKGSFGLIWDGPSAKTCEGVFGEYLKVNNPHKTSLFLAAGFPVIIWGQAALATFIETEQCGIVVDSISQIAEKLTSMTESDYIRLKNNACRVGQLLRAGAYTTAVLKSIKERN